MPRRPCRAAEGARYRGQGKPSEAAVVKAAGVTSHTSPPASRVRAHARGHSSASKWTGTRVPRNAGFPPMILPINRSLVGARVVSGPPRAGAKTRSLHEDRACEREFIPSCDVRLARRYEVPVMHDAVLARDGRPGQSVSPCSRSLVRRPVRRTNAGVHRCWRTI